VGTYTPRYRIPEALPSLESTYFACQQRINLCSVMTTVFFTHILQSCCKYAIIVGEHTTGNYSYVLGLLGANIAHPPRQMSFIVVMLLYWTANASIVPRSSLLGAGQLGFWEAGKGGWVNWVKGYKRGQFTDNLGPRWTIPVTSGGSQVSGRGHKGELVRGARGARGAKGGAPCICERNVCARVIEVLE
jgi:hypothetical protein